MNPFTQAFIGNRAYADKKANSILKDGVNVVNKDYIPINKYLPVNRSKMGETPIIRGSANILSGNETPVEIITAPVQPSPSEVNPNTKIEDDLDKAKKLNDKIKGGIEDIQARVKEFMKNFIGLSVDDPVVQERLRKAALGLAVAGVILIVVVTAAGTIIDVIAESHQSKSVETHPL